jgi:hypothetical protein
MVTAMVASYNYERFLGRALDSVLAQDYPADRLEIVVVDDGSTDGTPALLESYRAAHPERIRVIRQANQGNKAAANAAIAASRGELLAMLDADDTWPVDKTRRQVERLLGDHSLGLVYCDQEIIDADDRVLRASRFDWLDIAPQRGRGAFTEIMGGPGNIAVNSTLMFRRELVERIFPIPTRMTFQDWWIVGWASTLAGIDCVDGVRIGYRVHGANGVLGGTGATGVRAACRATEARRQMLVHGGGELLDEPALLAARDAWDHAARYAAQLAQTAYVPLIAADDGERAQVAAWADAAAEATLAGDRPAALRALVRAHACDPADGLIREQLHDLVWSITSISLRDRGTGESARRLVVLAGLPELLADPSLLAGYVSAVDEDDDATLVVIGGSHGAPAPVADLEEAVARAGLTLENLPDVLLCARDDPSARAVISAGAAALTDRWWEWRPTPTFRPGGFAALRAFGRLTPPPLKALATAPNT